jgi:hypothetical protein
MLELAMASSLGRQVPAILLKEAEDLGDFHGQRIPQAGSGPARQV